MKIYTYDTTLRDGAQSEIISYSKNDKINIIRILDALGIDFIEVGNPVYSPFDTDFFEILQNIVLTNSKIVYFAGTTRAGTSACNDAALTSISKAGKYTAIFGKAWDLHVSDVLKTTKEENLRIISDSIRFLKNAGNYVFFDAEHFFDGYKSDCEYALSVISAAKDAGADEIVLCDTNGGTFPEEIEKAVAEVCKKFTIKIGIHSHNDCGLAVSNIISAVKNGVVSVQGTINGIGERCGNANLATAIANLQLKLGYDVLPEGKISSLSGLSRAIAQISNISTWGLPYISTSAFSHKAGTHANAVFKNPKTFEHIEPSAVGNKRNVLLSEISGKSVIIPLLKKILPDFEINAKDEKVDQLLSIMKEKEAKGYHYEAAQASFGILARKVLGLYRQHFELILHKVINESKVGESSKSYAFLEVEVDGNREIAATDSDGPIHALDKALRKALNPFFSTLEKVQLIDYKVRVLDSRSASASRVRVLIDSTDGRDVWTTVGVSVDVIEASLDALIDSIEYKLLKDELNLL